MARSFMKGSLIVGPDLSSHKGTVDWTKLAKGYSIKGLRCPNAFMITRATEGQDFVDSKLFEFAEGAKKAGVPFGVYHIPTADFNGSIVKPDVKYEIHDFCKVLTELDRRGLRPDLIPWLDIEPGSKKDWMDQDTFAQWCRNWLGGVAAFLETYGQPTGKVSAGRVTYGTQTRQRGYPKRKKHSLGRKPGVYISQYLAKKFLPLGHGLGAAYPLWVVDYNQAPPRMPHGWSDAMVWQETDAGTCDGVDSDNVDLNIAQAALLRL